MSNLSILKMIMHELDLTKQHPQTVNQIIDLSTLPAEAVDFFAQHIGNVMKNKKIQNCQFIHEHAAVLEDCLEFAADLGNNQLFVDNSKHMASLLFQFMQASSSISSGALIFVQFLNNDNGYQYLSILKMDPNEAIQLDTANNTFKVQKDILPSVKENLHKCAIIKLVANLLSEDIHLRVLDKQQAKGEVSKFFLTNFLEAKKIVNDKSMTTMVQNQVIAYALEHELISAEQLASFSSEVDLMLSPGKSVDLDRDLESLFATYIEGEADLEDAVNSFKLKLLQLDENALFEFTAEVEKPLNYVISDSNKRIKLQFPSQFLNREVILGDYVEEGQIKGRTVTIKGLTLEEKVV